MTKEEQNQIIKDAWVRNLRKQDSIPEDIGDLYANWVRNLIVQANAQLTQETQPMQNVQNESGSQENQEVNNVQS